MRYYALFTCDQWKSTSSMSFRGVFTKTKLIKLLRGKDFEINEDINASLSTSHLNNAVTYGYIEELSINEEL